MTPSLVYLVVALIVLANALVLLPILWREGLAWLQDALGRRATSDPATVVNFEDARRRKDLDRLATAIDRQFSGRR